MTVNDVLVVKQKIVSKLLSHGVSRSPYETPPITTNGLEHSCISSSDNIAIAGSGSRCL